MPWLSCTAPLSLTVRTRSPALLKAVLPVASILRTTWRLLAYHRRDVSCSPCGLTLGNASQWPAMSGCGRLPLRPFSCPGLMSHVASLPNRAACQARAGSCSMPFLPPGWCRSTHRSPTSTWRLTRATASARPPPGRGSWSGANRRRIRCWEALTSLPYFIFLRHLAESLLFSAFDFLRCARPRGCQSTVRGIILARVVPP
jgi:hypothetical protein